MKKNSQKSEKKVIRAELRTSDVTKVKINMYGGMYTVEEFTSLIMAIMDTYIAGLVKVNSKEQVFKYFNEVFGICLNKIVPPKEHYKLSKEHKDFKKVLDNTLGREETTEDKKATEDNRMAAYLLCRDILTKEVGLTEESADFILNKRLGLLPDLKVPNA